MAEHVRETIETPYTGEGLPTFKRRGSLSKDKPNPKQSSDVFLTATLSGEQSVQDSVKKRSEHLLEIMQAMEIPTAHALRDM